MNNGVLSVDQRLNSVKIEYIFHSPPPPAPLFDRKLLKPAKYNRYDQLQHAADNLRQDLHGEIARSLDDVIKFKMHVQGGLAEFEKILEDEARNATKVDADIE